MTREQYAPDTSPPPQMPPPYMTRRGQHWRIWRALIITPVSAARPNTIHFPKLITRTMIFSTKGWNMRRFTMGQFLAVGWIHIYIFSFVFTAADYPCGGSSMCVRYGGHGGPTIAMGRYTQHGKEIRHVWYNSRYIGHVYIWVYVRHLPPRGGQRYMETCP